MTRTKGTISFWNDKKEYGFINPLDGGKRVFIHIRSFANRSRHPKSGQIVSYALSTDKQGRPCAIKATLAGDRLPQKTKHSDDTISITSATIFLLFVAATVITEKLPFVILTAYILASLITFITYAIDKSAAKKGNWRTPESTLHMLSLLGGWPGAILAQQKLRHKSQKQPFRAIFWLTVITNCGAFVWLLTPDGITTIKSILAGIA